MRRGIRWDDDSLENALLGGTTTPFRSSLGPARCLWPEQVARIARQLNAVGIDGFRDRFDPADLEQEGIPPPGWREEPERADRLAAAFAEFLRFYREAAAHGEGVLIVFI